LTFSCQTKKNQYSSHFIALDSTGLPKDSLALYFPKNIFSESDSFAQNWCSSTLYSFKEPVLSQKYSGHDIYRFLWLRSFHEPVVFSIHHKNSKVCLTTKILDREPMFYDDQFGAEDSTISMEEQQEYLKVGYSITKARPNFLIFEKKADRKANITYSKTIFLSINEWIEFEKHLQKANFWNLPTDIDNGLSTDGSKWVYEGHLKNKYHIVSYRSPYKKEYAKAGLFLIKLSGLKFDTY
jgi:hypothetical protein